MTEPRPYLTLDPRVEEAIRADRAAGWKNPCAFDDAQVTRREPNPHDEATLARPAFARDIEKILNVPAYNRYADKTQVFSFVENDDISPARPARAAGEPHRARHRQRSWG